MGNDGKCDMSKLDSLFTFVPGTGSDWVSPWYVGIDPEGHVADIRTRIRRPGDGGCGPDCVISDVQILVDRQGNIERVNNIVDHFSGDDTFEPAQTDQIHRTITYFTVDMWQRIQGKLRLLQSGEILQEEPHSLDCSLCWIGISGEPIDEAAAKECEKTNPHEADLNLGLLGAGEFSAMLMIHDKNKKGKACNAMPNNTLVFLRDDRSCFSSYMKYVLPDIVVEKLTGFSPSQILNVRRIQKTDLTGDCKPTIDFAPKTITIEGTNFASGKAELTEAGKRALDENIEYLTKNPHLQITIEGHTDDLGSDSANLKLSKGRAESVRAYLQEKGILAGRMQTFGRGESQPKVPDNSEASRALNRRVEIKLYLNR